jgi:hypothetical protein
LPAGGPGYERLADTGAIGPAVDAS